jgi:hypothetical protein
MPLGVLAADPECTSGSGVVFVLLEHVDGAMGVQYRPKKGHHLTIGDVRCGKYKQHSGYQRFAGL